MDHGVPSGFSLKPIKEGATNFQKRDPAKELPADPFRSLRDLDAGVLPEVRGKLLRVLRLVDVVGLLQGPTTPQVLAKRNVCNGYVVSGMGYHQPSRIGYQAESLCAFLFCSHVQGFATLPVWIASFSPLKHKFSPWAKC